MRVSVEVAVADFKEAAVHQQSFEEAALPVISRYPAAHIDISQRTSAGIARKVRRPSGSVVGYRD
jgi:hypothetical protein